jgi:hypothetical protein
MSMTQPWHHHLPEITDSFTHFARQHPFYRQNPDAVAGAAEKLIHQLANDARFDHLDAHAMKEIIGGSFAAQRPAATGGKVVSFAERVGRPATEITADHVFEAMNVRSKAQAAIETQRTAAATSAEVIALKKRAATPPAAPKPPGRGFQMDPAHGVGGALSLLVAGLTALSAWSTFQNAHEIGEDGKTHLKPSAVALAVVYTALAAGSTFLGVDALRKGMMR